MSISHWSGAEGGQSSKDWYVSKYYTEIWKYVHFLTERCQNYRLYQKIVQIKVVENCILYKKVIGGASLSPPGVELVGSKDWYVSNLSG